MTELRAPRLTCRELVDVLTDYLEDVLPPLERARVEEHLAICPDCRAYLEQMRTTIGLLGGLREETVPAGTVDELLRAFRRWNAA
jgi:predicted anti-sigma-YlaC factor YlaD